MREVRDSRLRVVLVRQDARDITDEHQFLGIERPCDCRGGGIGIDVVSLAAAIDGNRRNDRNRPLRQDGKQHVAVHFPHFPDEAQVERRAGCVGKLQFLAVENVPAQVAEPGRVSPQLANLMDQVIADFTGQHLCHDVERPGVGIASSLNEARFEAGLLHGGGDGLSPAVNQHGAHADRFHENHVGEKVSHRLGVFERAPPQLDHDQPVAKAADPAHGFDQDFGFAKGVVHASSRFGS
jgi:hypothetical protein